MTSVADAITALSRVRGLAMVQSPDRGAGLAAAVQVARGLVPPEYRDSDIVVMSPEGARWTLPDLTEQLRYEQGYLPAGEQRVIVLDRADQMDVRAAENLLLRVEEPVAEVVYLAVVRDEQAMLPTLRSRSMLTIDAPDRNIHSALPDTVTNPSGRLLRLLPLAPLTEASLPDTATKAVPLLEDLLASPTGDTFTAAFTIPAQLRAAAKAVSGKGPNDPQTRAVQRELIAAWLDLQHQDAITALRTNPTPTTVAECNRLEEARDMLPMHLPLEHVVGYACRKAPTP